MDSVRVEDILDSLENRNKNRNEGIVRHKSIDFLTNPNLMLLSLVVLLVSDVNELSLASLISGAIDSTSL